MGFGSDGIATMLGLISGMATKLKKISPFLTSVHCIAYRTNLAALEAAKSTECKSLSIEIDALVNSLAAYFKNSGKRKCALNGIQKELNDAQKTMKRLNKIRWFSRFQAISTLCDSLESVLVYFRDVPREKDDGIASLLYDKLRNFKYIYILYFLADLLHGLTILSKIFQYKFVDITNIGSLVKTQIESIRMLYVVDNTDLNHETFNESYGYHVIPYHGPQGGYLQRLSSEIRGAKFHGIDMIRDNTGADLESALFFQKSYAESIIKALETRFHDNHLISAFKILNPSNMPSRRVGLASWGMTKL